jgi:hypothetical protein
MSLAQSVLYMTSYNIAYLQAFVLSCPNDLNSNSLAAFLILIVDFSFCMVSPLPALFLLLPYPDDLNVLLLWEVCKDEVFW